MLACKWNAQSVHAPEAIMRCAASSAVWRASLLTGCSPTYRSNTAAANAGLLTAEPSSETPQSSRQAAIRLEMTAH